MKILITDSFKKDFIKLIKSRNWLSIFLDKINNDQLIRLNEDLSKFKFYIGNVSIRGLIFKNINDCYIPVLIVKKTDKKYGDNLVLSKDISTILKTKLDNMRKDMQNGKYEFYDL